MLSFRIFVFLCGFVIGVLLYFVVYISKKETILKLDTNCKIDLYKLKYEAWLKEKGIRIEKANMEELRYGKNRTVLMKTLESQLLFDLVHVTCVVFVEKQRNAYFIDSTWGQKCNRVIYYNTVKDDNVKTYVIPFINKWQFLCDTFRHLWVNVKPLQWVLFSADDVYVIPENIRYFIAIKDFNVPYYFGHKVKYLKQIYNTGDTSYLLSYGAIRALMTKLNISSTCRQPQQVREAELILGKYLSELGITAGESRDYRGRERFHTSNVLELMGEERSATVERRSKTSFHPVVNGKNCCSDTSISFRRTNIFFHYIDYLFYHLCVFKTGTRKNDEPETNETWKMFYEGIVESERKCT